jgi:putative redox protein
MSEKSGAIIARAEAQMEIAHYACTIRTGRHSLIADEPKGAGGDDAGPSPFCLLLSSLAACTAITLRMYADRKSWPLAEIGVSLSYRWDGETPRVERTIRLDGLNDEQRRRCLEIADKTPVTRALKSGVTIETRLQ